MNTTLEQILIHSHIVAELDDLTAPPSPAASPRVEDPRPRAWPRRRQGRFVALWLAVRDRLRAMPAMPAFGALFAALACTDPAPVARVEAVAVVVVAPAERRLVVGDTVTLVAGPRSAAGRPLEGRSVSWAASDTTVATVSATGRVTGIAVGATTIRATSEGVMGDAVVLVGQRGPLPVDRVVVSPAAIVLVPGGAQQLSAVVRDSAGTVLTDRLVAWRSHRPTVAVVSATGLVTAVQAGQATIDAASEGKTFAVSVTVTPPPAVVRLDLAPASGTLAVGEALQFTAQPRGAGNEPLDRPVTWRSSDDRLATVDATGRVTGHRPGLARITATSAGLSRHAEVWVYAVNQYRLVHVGDGALPRTLFTTVETGAGGTVRGVRWDAHEGYFRLGFDGRYEQAIAYWIHREGAPAVSATYVYRGTWFYDVASPGSLVFYPLSASPSFRGRLLTDGALAITRRLEPNTPELTFLHSPP